MHFSPHILRHIWATRLVDAGVRPLHLMEAGGWSNVEMVRRYYTCAVVRGVPEVTATPTRLQPCI